MTQTPPDLATKTYRYLRLGLLLVLVALLVSVAIERLRAPGCWQESISGYYYTPVQSVFVGALAAVGLGMVALYGNTKIEDLLLNLGGMLAPVVAVVPTPDASACSSAPGQADPGALLAAAADDVDNGVPTLLAVGVVALLVVLGAAWRARESQPWGAAERTGFGLAVVLLGAGAGWYAADRNSFVGRAHLTAAALLFLCIAGVVAANGRDRAASRPATAATRRAANRYWVLFGLMAVSTAVIGVVAVATGWRYWLLALETDLLVMFAVFWLMQTAELWGTGSRLRRTPAGG